MKPWTHGAPYSTHNHPTRFWQVDIFEPYKLVATSHGETDQEVLVLARQICDDHNARFYPVRSSAIEPDTYREETDSDFAQHGGLGVEPR